MADRLFRAAGNISVKGTPLRPRFFVPTDSPRAKKDLDRFFDVLSERDGGARWYGFMAGLLSTIGAKEETAAVSLRLEHCPKPLWARMPQWHGISMKCFGRPVMELPAVPVVLLARVTREEGRHGPWLSAHDAAALPLADTRCWVPVEGGLERRIALRLVKQDRQFHKPLGAEEQPSLPLPSFVLEDCEPPAPVSVTSEGPPVPNAAPHHWTWDGTCAPPAFPPVFRGRDSGTR